MGDPPLLAVRGLRVRFRSARGGVTALAGIDLTVRRGAFQVVIGESGSGKSVLAHSLLGLLPGNVDLSGSVRLDGEELLTAGPARLRQLRARRLAFVPQSPATALNPVRRVGSLLVEGAAAKGIRRSAAPQALRAAAGALGLDYDSVSRRYAHQLSGGMQQRALSSLALVGRPDLVVADEPTSGLDADRVGDTATQLRRLADRGAGVLVITHDLALAAELGGRVAVLYAGHLVEERPSAAFFDAPAHPYAVGLLDALPERGGEPIPGLPPSMTDPPPGCPFAPRCALAESRCDAAVPGTVGLADGSVRCLLHAAR